MRSRGRMEWREEGDGERWTGQKGRGREGRGRGEKTRGGERVKERGWGGA